MRDTPYTQKNIRKHAEEEAWYIWNDLGNLVEALKDTSLSWEEICNKSSKGRLQEWKNNLLDSVLIQSIPQDQFISFVVYTGGCLSDIYHEETQAIALFQSVIATGKAPAQIHHMLATSYIRIGDDYNAEVVLENIVSNDELRTDADYNLMGGSIRAKLAIVKMRISGEFKIDEKRLNDAASLIREASNMEGLSQQSPVRHGQLASVEMSLGNYDVAEYEYRKAIELTDKTGNIWDETMIAIMQAEYKFGLGQLLHITNRTEEGAVLMSEAINLVDSTGNLELKETFANLLKITLAPQKRNSPHP